MTWWLLWDRWKYGFVDNTGYDAVVGYDVDPVRTEAFVFDDKLCCILVVNYDVLKIRLLDICKKNDVTCYGLDGLENCRV